MAEKFANYFACKGDLVQRSPDERETSHCIPQYGCAFAVVLISGVRGGIATEEREFHSGREFQIAKTRTLARNLLTLRMIPLHYPS